MMNSGARQRAYSHRVHRATGGLPYGIAEGGVVRRPVLQLRLKSLGETEWWFRPLWNRKKDHPSVLDVERLLREHRGEIQQLLSG